MPAEQLCDNLCTLHSPGIVSKPTQLDTFTHDSLASGRYERRRESEEIVKKKGSSNVQLERKCEGYNNGSESVAK